MISTPLPSVEQMKDILDLKDVTLWDLRWVWGLAISLSVILLLLMLRRIIRKWRLKPPTPPKPLTPIELALKKLDELLQSRFLETGQVRRFYFGLSELFREFMEGELGLKACEETLEELRPVLKKRSDLKSEEVQEAIALLEVADLAKFAKYVPEKDDILTNIRDCRRWMNQVAERGKLALQSNAGTTTQS